MTPARLRALLRLAAALIGVNLVFLMLAPQDDLYAWAPVLLVAAILVMFGPPVLRRMRRTSAPMRPGAERRHSFVVGRTVAAVLQGAFLVALLALEVLAIASRDIPDAPARVWIATSGPNVVRVATTRGGDGIEGYDAALSGWFGPSGMWVVPADVDEATEMSVISPAHPLPWLRHELLGHWRGRGTRYARIEAAANAVTTSGSVVVWTEWRDVYAEWRD